MIILFYDSDEISIKDNNLQIKKRYHYGNKREQLIPKCS